jgi:hypothetical protein
MAPVLGDGRVVCPSSRQDSSIDTDGRQTFALFEWTSACGCLGCSPTWTDAFCGRCRHHDGCDERTARVCVDLSLEFVQRSPCGHEHGGCLATHLRDHSAHPSAHSRALGGHQTCLRHWRPPDATADSASSCKLKRATHFARGGGRGGRGAETSCQRRVFPMPHWTLFDKKPPPHNGSCFTNIAFTFTNSSIPLTITH